MNAKFVILLFFVGYSTAIEGDEFLFDDDFWTQLKTFATSLFGDEMLDDAEEREDVIRAFEDFHPRRDAMKAKILAMLKKMNGDDEDDVESDRRFDALNAAQKVQFVEDLIKLKHEGSKKASKAPKHGDYDYN